MTGHLQLELAADAAGRTHIGRQSFHAPMHLSKPYWDGRHLIVQAVNCTAGLLSGDHIDIAVHSFPGSSAIVTSPSAQRAFQARADAFASIDQVFKVDGGAWLEVSPEIFIPHKGSRVRQSTRIEVSSDSELLYMESLAPGRVASSESYAFECLKWTTDLFLEDTLLVRERYDLSPQERNIRVLRRHFPDAYYASCYLVSPRLPLLADLRARAHAWSSSELHLAASLLSPSVAAVKILASGSLSLRHGVQLLREYCYSSLGRPLPVWRKL